MASAVYSSPIGPIEIHCNSEYIISITFKDEVEPLFQIPEQAPLLHQCFQQLDEYFDGKRKEFTVPIYQEGTAFQKQVWTQLLTIPYGITTSYAELSKQLGDIKKIRAVGTTNGKNKLAIIVPCHRVIGSNQQLIGYAGGLWRKRWLLDHESKFTPGVRQLSLV